MNDKPADKSTILELAAMHHAAIQLGSDDAHELELLHDIQNAVEKRREEITGEQVP